MADYIFRNVDPKLWATVKTRALADGLTIRTILTRALQVYAAGKTSPVGWTADPRARTKTRATAKTRTTKTHAKKTRAKKPATPRTTPNIVAATTPARNPRPAPSVPGLCRRCGHPKTAHGAKSCLMGCTCFLARYAES